MPFFLLEFAMRAVETAWAIGLVLSEAPENRADGPPEMSDRHGDGFQMQVSRPETGCRARSESARATPHPVVKGPLAERQRIELTKFA
jgi:hypothetical protein